MFSHALFYGSSAASTIFPTTPTTTTTPTRASTTSNPEDRTHTAPSHSYDNDFTDNHDDHQSELNADHHNYNNNSNNESALVDDDSPPAALSAINAHLMKAKVKHPSSLHSCPLPQSLTVRV
jgi:hypothetical protein